MITDPTPPATEGVVALQLHTAEDGKRILDEATNPTLVQEQVGSTQDGQEEPTLAEEEEAPAIPTEDAAERSSAPLEAVYSKIRGADTVGLRVMMLRIRPRQG